jgi:hypothetical protein
MREVVAWLPIFLVVIVTAAALTVAGSPPATAAMRRLWLACILVCGSVAIAGSVWQERRAAGDIADLRGAATSAPPSMADSGPVAAALAEKVKALEAELKEREGLRTISADAAAGLTAYLRQFGGHRVVVSCLPDDAEAYSYANQLVNILRAADWDAQGPELTRIFGDVRAFAINVYVGSANHSDTAKLLLDGFAKFNIPYQSRVAPTEAIPDSETVELFVGASPLDRAVSGSD